MKVHLEYLDQLVIEYDGDGHCIIVNKADAITLRDELTALLDQPSEPAAATETPSAFPHLDLVAAITALYAQRDEDVRAIGHLSDSIDHLRKNTPENGVERIGVLETRVASLCASNTALRDALKKL